MTDRAFASRALDALLVAALIVLVVFPLAVVAAAPGLPSATRYQPLAPLRRGPGGEIRTLPVLTPHGQAAREVASRAVLTPEVMDAELTRLATTVFGVGGHAVLDLVRSEESVITFHQAGEVYPFRNEAVDALIAATGGAALAHPDDANDLAALLTIAAANPHRLRGYTNAAPVAYAILEQVRTLGGCRAQLNLFFLVTANRDPHEDSIPAEGERTAAACPHDPTPWWLLGQRQSQVALSAVSSTLQARAPRRVRATYATFHTMQRRFPRSPASWAGEADFELRLGYGLDRRNPFTARGHFRRANALFARSRRLWAESHDGPMNTGLLNGSARAEAGLQRVDAALSLQRRALDQDRTSAPLQVRLADYLERAHRFGAAATQIARDLHDSRFAAGTSLVADLDSVFFADDPRGRNLREDETQPMSIGVDDTKPVILDVAEFGGGAGAAVTDLSFIPTYRTRTSAVWLVDDERWCREWSRRRDLLLAGRAAAALDHLPSGFRDFRTGDACGDLASTTDGASFSASSTILRAVAERELGHVGAGIASLQKVSGEATRSRSAVLGDLEETRQNLWRYGGSYGHAADVVAHWIHELPRDGRARHRAGEIAFLRHDYLESATRFGQARPRFDAAYRAEADLDRGAALERAGDHDAAKRLFDRGFRLAAAQYDRTEPQLDAAKYDAYIAYNTRVQAGDNELRRQRFEAAEHAYARARTWEERLDPETKYVLVRPAALHNNESLVLAELGRGDEAIAAARRALADDPENPLFLLTLGYAQRVDGHLRAAASTYAHALRSDPTVAPAANDLGVLRARGICGRRDRPRCHADAVALFEQAAATAPDYALPRWNLGVLRGRDGASGFFASQAWFAAAERREPELRKQDPTLRFDDDAYLTTLDLSKPLPPTWHLGARVQRLTPALGILVALLLIVRGSYRVVGELFSTRTRRRFTAMSDRFNALAEHPVVTRVRGWGRRTPPLVAIVVATGVLSYPLIASDGSTVVEVVALAVAVAVVSGALVRYRVRVAIASGQPVRQWSWVPAIVAGIAATVVHFTFAPVPVTDDEPPNTRLHLAGPIFVGSIATVLLVLGRLTGVPITRAVGYSAFVIALSLMVSVAPLDGAYVEGRRMRLGLGAAVMVVVLLVGFGVL